MKSGFKRFLPAFMVGLFSESMRKEKSIDAKPQKRIGKSKGGGNGSGFISKTLRPTRSGTALGNAITLYKDISGIKYGKPNLDGCRALMAKNWHREFMGKS